MNGRVGRMAFVLCAAILITAAAGSNGGDRKAAKGPALSPASWDQAVKVRTVTEVGDSIELEYAMPALTLVEITDPVKRALLGAAADEVVVSVKMGNAFVTGGIGDPMLPVVPAKILLPAGYDVDRIDVTAGGKVDVDGTFVVEQMLQSAYRDQGIGGRLPTARNAAVYGSDSAHPGTLYDVLGVQKKRGMSILYVNLFPVQYRGKSGKISYYTDFDVKVSLKPGAVPEAGGVKVRLDPISPVEGEVDNPKAAATYHPEMSFATPTVTLPTGNYQYVVITTDALKNALISPNLNDLIKHKQSRGYTATIQTMEWIKANYTGPTYKDDADKMRSFIRDAYNQWGTDYVCLFGNPPGGVPRRLCLDPSDPWYGYEDQVATDIYFCCLDGDWNDDNDQWYGETNDGPGRTEVDLTFEVYVGRVPIDVPQEMSNYVAKVLTYDTQADTAQFRRALLLGTKLGEGWFGSVECEQVRLGNSWPTTTLGFVSAPVTITCDQQYETDTPPYYYDAPEIKGWINTNNYGIIFESGHGSNDWAMKTCGMYAIDEWTNSQLFFFTTEACHPGQMAYCSFAESTMGATSNNCAVGCMLNTQYGLGGYNTLMEFWDQPVAHGARNFGLIKKGNTEALVPYIHQNLNWWRYCVFQCTLFCDPETRLRGWETARTISASAGTGGWIYPTGTVNAEQAENRTFTITPDSGYAISDVTVDGGSQGAISSYTFTNLTANHTISATFTSTASAYAISGSVKDSAAVGIAGAMVCFKTSAGAQTNPNFTVLTDASGNYSKAVVNGTWYVVAWKWGYQLPTEQVVTVNGAPVPNKNFTLTVPAIPTPVIKLDTSGLKLGAITAWSNTGSLGSKFTNDQTGPVVQTVGGKKAVTFDGVDDHMKSLFNAPAGITGTHAFTIAIWAYNPVVSGYEYVMSLAKYNTGLGMPDTESGEGETTTVSYPSSSSYGACSWTDIAVDHNWMYSDFHGGSPSAGAWHHICVTYDGNAEKVYVDGTLNSTHYRTIKCLTGYPVFLACAYENQGGLNDWKGWFYSGSLGAIRVYDLCLTADQVLTLKNQSW